ncbi:hypothetical protein C2S51_003406 [Perilla frutescens var. frutescens]|nr:hypothetical protein C2S51_003406 [Perilla frutescens var. frutescens]
MSKLFLARTSRTLPTLLNLTINALEKKKTVRILADVSGIVKPLSIVQPGESSSSVPKEAVI